MLTEGGMRSQETETSAAAAMSKAKNFTGSIGDDEADFAAVFGRAGVEQAADGVDGLAAFADDAGQIGLLRLHGVDVFAVDRGVGEENLVGMTGEPAEDEVEKFLHDRAKDQAALASAPRAFLTMLRTVSDICAPFLTQWSMRASFTV